MKIIFIADLHVHNHLGNTHYIEKAGEFLEYIGLYCVDNEVKNLIILGDIFNCNSHINHEALLTVNEKLHDIKEKGVSITILTGNHDLYRKASIEMAMTQIFARSFHVVKDYETLIIDDVLFHFKNYGGDIKVNNFGIEDDKYNVLCSHIELNGFKMGNIVIKEGISPEVFTKFKKIFNGHHHDHEEKGNVIIPGTPYHNDFSDVGKEKGFIVFDTETKDTEFVKYDGITYVEIDVDEETDFSKYKGMVVRLKYDKENVSDKKLQQIKRELLENNLYVDAKGKKEEKTLDDTELDVDLQTFDDAYKEYIKKYSGDLDQKIMLEKYNDVRTKVKK